jgi:hypothetical protein
MVNGVAGRALPRLIMAIAEYHARFGEWPAEAHGSLVMSLVEESLAQGEFNPDLAARIRRRLACSPDGEGMVSGPAGHCDYGQLQVKGERLGEAKHWLLGD